MIDVIILTSSNNSVAAHHLPILFNSEKINIKRVIVSNGLIKDKKKYYKRKFLKLLRIGLFGTLNGFRMRKWYGDDLQKFHKTIPLDVFCKQNSIPYFTTDYTNSEETAQLFKDSEAVLGLSLGNGFISKKIFSIPKFGMINIHHEILPDYQNAQSVIWQLYNDSKYSGYTIHKIDSKIDTGEIIHQEKVPIIYKESLAATVTSTLAAIENASANGLVTVLEDFENYFSSAKNQNNGNHYTTPSFFQFIRIYKNYKKLKSKQNSND